MSSSSGAEDDQERSRLSNGGSQELADDIQFNESTGKVGYCIHSDARQVNKYKNSNKMMVILKI
jgi:hypothetical protein